MCVLIHIWEMCVLIYIWDRIYVGALSVCAETAKPVLWMVD